ncbi:unnamed protein product [Fusarium graminearum]|uniref:Chromosome 1, complete genome n=1 Tax=Gibberella zeae (strain ATCC MYA-4620 / CBS 123657 / FGSC 9075 / NRRL 31084 / PH-1) TaxID=229533 RepID=A0A098DC82_GIBZE|nr:unnamed protein product [Fusarium graminearum]CZS78851.1 unnamed protein product [Fusarium graminearum]
MEEGGFNPGLPSNVGTFRREATPMLGRKEQETAKGGSESIRKSAKRKELAPSIGRCLKILIKRYLSTNNSIFNTTTTNNNNNNSAINFGSLPCTTLAI